MPDTKNIIDEVLRQYQDPYLNTDLLSARVLKNLTETTDSVDIQLEFGFPLHPDYKHQIQTTLLHALQRQLPEEKINFSMTSHILNHAVQSGLKPLPHVKNIIAVGSGKGGVGKSTTAVNLALALYREGAQVGLLDADIYGPNQPQMLGISEKPQSIDNKKLEPVIAHGLQTMSIGYLVDKDTPMIWRGPMVSGALQQLLYDTNWHNLDYLILDLPPGTGDVQLTMAQKIPVSGAVIVSTPQEIALLDVRKAIGMFRKVNVPLLGIIENMSTHICSHCGNEEAIFGHGGGDLIARQFQIDLLGQLPLNMHIREQADKGTPIVISNPAHPASLAYIEIARKIAARLSLCAKNVVSKFPKIEIQNR